MYQLEIQNTPVRKPGSAASRHKVDLLNGLFCLARIVIGHGRAPSKKGLVAICAIQDHLDEGEALGINA
jgi:hypothetical protein